MTRRDAAFVAFALVVPVTGAAGQTVNDITGAIVGRVSDQTAAALRGVTIAISSPALIGSFSIVSERSDQHRRRRPARVHDLVRQDPRHVRSAVGCPSHADPASPVGAAFWPHAGGCCARGHSDPRRADRHTADGPLDEPRPARRKGFQLPAHGRVAAFIDVFNLLNANAEQNINWVSGPSFLRPLTIVAPRIARIGVKVDW